MPPVPPLNRKLRLTPNPAVASVMMYVQTSPVCVIETVNAPPFTLSVAWRVAPGFGWIVKLKEELVPVEAESVIHDGAPVTDQLHEAVLKFAVPLPPA